MDNTHVSSPFLRLVQSLALLVLFFAFATSLAAAANGAAQALVDDQGLTGGSVLYPDIPAASWAPFEAVIATGTTDRATGNIVDQLSAEVVLPASTGHTFIKNRVPSVLYRFSGNATELSQPLVITWPNVMGYGPGEAHLVIGFDPTTSTWQICGSAVVSADGLSLVQTDSSHNTFLSDYYVDDATLLTLPGSGS